MVKKPEIKNPNHALVMKLSNLVGSQLDKLHLKANPKQAQLRTKCGQALLEPEGRLFHKSSQGASEVTAAQVTEATRNLQAELNKVYDSNHGLEDSEDLAKHLAELQIIGEVIAFNLTDEFDLTYQNGFQKLVEAYKHRIKKYLLKQT